MLIGLWQYAHLAFGCDAIAYAAFRIQAGRPSLANWPANRAAVSGTHMAGHITCAFGKSRGQSANLCRSTSAEANLSGWTSAAGTMTITLPSSSVVALLRAIQASSRVRRAKAGCSAVMSKREQ